MCESKININKKILAIVATLNEEEGIGPTLSELTQFLNGCKLLVVDGNSTDGRWGTEGVRCGLSN